MVYGSFVPPFSHGIPHQHIPVYRLCTALIRAMRSNECLSNLMSGLNGFQPVQHRPVRKLMMRSSRKKVSEMLLNAIQWALRSSLKKAMMTGRIIKFAINRFNINRSQ